jgi:hypothetical protein
LLGIGVCPFEMPSQLSATVYDQTINQKSVTKDQQNLSHVSTPVGAELNPSSFQPNLATGSSFMGGRNAKRVAALYN